MNEYLEEQLPQEKIFRFVSGELCQLTDEQIDKIPYLSTMVSAAERFPSIRNENGFYKLDPNIQSNHFAFVLKSFSFVGVRQIFTHLRKCEDILSVLALFDFLGLTPQYDPTFEEIDLTFFSTMIYKPSLGKYLEKIRENELQDMAVRFAMALARENYDYTDSKIIDHIYWFILFILSAYQYFGPRLRHHVHRIAEYYFSLFSPSHLEPLRRLFQQVNKGTMTLLNSINEDYGFYEEEKIVCDENLFLSYLERPCVPVKREPVLDELLWHSQYHRDYCFGLRTIRWNSYYQSDQLEPIYKIVADTMYERLQYQINKRLASFFHPECLRSTDDSVYQVILENLFRHDLVKEDIDRQTFKEISKITPKLEEEHNELVNKLREYEQETQNEGQWNNNEQIFPFHFSSRYENHQDKTLKSALLLEKIYQQTPILIEIREGVITRLHTAAKAQIKQWQKTQRSIRRITDPKSSDESDDEITLDDGWWRLVRSRPYRGPRLSEEQLLLLFNIPDY